MSDLEERFHEEWLGMVQPVDGLVVSIPVLVDAECASRQPLELQRHVPETIDDLGAFLEGILGWTPDRYLAGDALPEDLRLYVPEGGQTLRPTLALKSARDDEPPVALLWDLGPDCVGLPLDKPETRTGPWEYPPSAKLDRLLRHTRIAIGVLTNRTHVRLVYAPHGESTGSITFRLSDMTKVDGRPILDAFVMLLGATRFYSVAPERQLPAILAESRKRQANVTNDLADQVFEALEILLRGFESAAERDGRKVLDAAYAREGDHLYGGLLTQLLRLVFVLYAEDQGLLPVEDDLYAEHLSVLGLFEELQHDHGTHPDSMSRRFGAYGRLTALFRAVYLGVEHGPLKMPARRGTLFSPQEYPFLEGWEGEPGSAPIVDPGARAATRVPSIDDETVFRVLEKLLILKRQRLSYRALDVEQIGSVYEALMGYSVLRLGAEAVCLKPSRVWVTADEVLAEKSATRTRWLQETAGLAKGQADKLNKALGATKKEADALAVLEEHAVSGQAHLPAGRFVIQPGPERRRTSSHYTPRSLTAPIVKKTLDPLFRAMGENPPSDRILNLKICDPAMGSGAFLVEACRYLADQVVSAWTREGRRDLLAGSEDATLLARRLVAQRCLYGVDKNPYAVNLAKLSLWLVTLARDLPFTFLDHALRHGDTLVGLSFDQITAFHWKPGKQLELCQKELEAVLGEAVAARQRILELAADPSPAAQSEKEWSLRDAEDALERVRTLGDLVVGAFFSSESDKEREKERDRRLDLVLPWLRIGGLPTVEITALRDETQRRLPVFHWMAEYPEVFWIQRPDPLDRDKTGCHAWIDAFVGNPPFLGGKRISEDHGGAYSDWLSVLHETSKNGDLSAHFFLRASKLLGDHGTIGLVATNTIAQGDTRQAGLQPLLALGLRIYDATRSMPWPGDAAVSVSLVHLEKGRPAELDEKPPVLDGVLVASITSRLRAGQEQPDPKPLAANAGLSFQGSIVLGMGFVLTTAERNLYIGSDKRNGDRIFPYLGGEELNTSPEQRFDRYVINFGSMSLEDAERWPDLLSRLRTQVKPEREKTKESRNHPWWQFWRPRTELAAALADRKSCIVTSRVTKHLMFSFQPTDRVFSDRMYVFPLETHSAFAVLQSRVHEPFARLLSSTLEDRLNYCASDCFETFPFPGREPDQEMASLKEIGTGLYERRAAYMVTTQRGLTQIYNLLKDATCHDPEIEALRALHVEMDRQVLAAYGWHDLIDKVPPYTTPTTDAERVALSAFEDAVIDRLFALNAERAEEERIQGLAGAAKTGGKGGAKAAAGGKRGRGRKKAPTNQLSLASGGDPDPE